MLKIISANIFSFYPLICKGENRGDLSIFPAEIIQKITTGLELLSYDANTNDHEHNLLPIIGAKNNDPFDI